MKTKILSIVLALSIFSLPILSTPVYAGSNDSSSLSIGLCTFIPFICNAISGDDGSVDAQSAQKFLTDRLQLVVSLIFIGIMLISVFIIVRAGLKYIQSQGDPDKIKDATKAIQSVFVGIGVLVVGIVGLLLVLAFFNITGVSEAQCTIENGTVVCPN